MLADKECQSLIAEGWPKSCLICGYSFYDKECFDAHRSKQGRHMSSYCEQESWRFETRVRILQGLVVPARSRGVFCLRMFRGQVSKTAKHARSLLAINVSKWRTTNEISPRTSASHQAVGTFVQILIFG